MVEPENKLVCRGDTGVDPMIDRRMKALLELGLLEAQTTPVFEEATQTAAHLLEVPICILGFLDRNRHVFKSAVGLSRLGLMNPLAQERQLPIHESFCTQVVETSQIVNVGNTRAHPAFTNSVLVQRYGILAYLEVPLIDSSGLCLGAIAVMDLEPRNFSIQQMKFLELMARWSMSEFERNRLLKMQQLEPLEQRAIEVAPQILNPAPAISFSPPTALPEALSIVQVKLKLLEQLTQELRTPLTSILGMANVVGREIYGPLTTKQKEYLEIIQNSGRYLLSLVNEVSQLGVVEEYSLSLNLTTVDIEMLCQQVLNTLDEVAKRKEQKLRLSLEPAKSRMWVLDKDKVRQLIYHLISSMIQAATSGSAIRIHISYKGNSTLDRVGEMMGQSNLLNLAISVSHPWLGEGLTPVDPYLGQISTFHAARTGDERQESKSKRSMHEHDDREEDKTELVNVNSFNRSCESLRLLLSRALAELHGGQIDILGTPESGYRYVVSLPELTLAQANTEI
ncbi:MAG: hypothetical protein N4J56_005730 [Chroococcidiopsis sp. SAG 2025]|uniref:GAF domain-containing sensor histidine kinase n=1 Tax=Chroococcidiopsis sp. SAG 2025 TaxID=171389 RepID=UPI002936E08E|nr:GAF domain-containing sensor histidine kinase [Chroococcidiopsis sp. SAG 2025]MDV2996076.1 hypothetical protein [Chroococcidiopsis sp. SAG 2025]